jgi:hypothetical protein
VSNNEWFEDLSLDVINHERKSTDACLGLSTWSIHHLPATGSTDKIYKSWKEGKLINLLTPYILLEFNGRLTFLCRLMIAPKVWFISCFLYKIPICLRNPQNQNYWIFPKIGCGQTSINPSIGSPTVCRIPCHPRHLRWLTSFNVAHLQPVIDSYRLF